MKERNKRYLVASIVRAKPSFLVGLGEVPEDEIKAVGDQKIGVVCLKNRFRNNSLYLVNFLHCRINCC